MRHEGVVDSMFASCAPLRKEVLFRIMRVFRLRDSTIVNSPIYMACQLNFLYTRVRSLSDLRGDYNQNLFDVLFRCLYLEQSMRSL